MGAAPVFILALYITRFGLSAGASIATVVPVCYIEEPWFAGKLEVQVVSFFPTKLLPRCSIASTPV